MQRPILKEIPDGKVLPPSQTAWWGPYNYRSLSKRRPFQAEGRGNLTHPSVWEKHRKPARKVNLWYATCWKHGSREDAPYRSEWYTSSTEIGNLDQRVKLRQHFHWRPTGIWSSQQISWVWSQLTGDSCSEGGKPPESWKPTPFSEGLLVISHRDAKKEH